MLDVTKNLSYHTIVFVAHGGPLEAKSALLAASLSMNYLPHKISCCLIEPVSLWGNISSETTTLFKKLGVGIHSARNEIDEKYPHGNKIASLGSIEGPSLFLDSDMLLIKPFSWHYEIGGDFAAKPADLDTYSRGGGQWSLVYELFEKELPSYQFRATTTSELMRPYFNAGFISVKDGRTFTEAWVEASRKIDECKQIVNKRPWLDQIALPVAVNLLGWQTTIVTDKFNYPCHLKKFGQDLPYFAHYHWPSIIQQNSLLHQELKKLLRNFPILKKILTKYDDWCDLVQLT